MAQQQDDTSTNNCDTDEIVDEEMQIEEHDMNGLNHTDTMNDYIQNQQMTEEVEIQHDKTNDTDQDFHEIPDEKMSHVMVRPPSIAPLVSTAFLVDNEIVETTNEKNNADKHTCTQEHDNCTQVNSSCLFVIFDIVHRYESVGLLLIRRNP